MEVLELNKHVEQIMIPESEDKLGNLLYALKGELEDE